MFSVGENQQPIHSNAGISSLPSAFSSVSGTSLSDVNFLTLLSQSQSALSTNLLQNLVAKLPLSQAAIGSAVSISPEHLLMSQNGTHKSFDSRQINSINAEQIRASSMTPESDIAITPPTSSLASIDTSTIKDHKSLNAKTNFSTKGDTTIGIEDHDSNNIWYE